MAKRLGLLFGILFLFGGTLGFVPGVIKDGLYLGIFRVNPPHNLLHLCSGAIFLGASMLGARFARLWFLTFGLLYAAIAALGFQVGDGMVCGIISNNQNDSWGHAGLALTMLVIFFATSRQVTPRSSSLLDHPESVATR